MSSGVHVKFMNITIFYGLYDFNTYININAKMIYKTEIKQCENQFVYIETWQKFFKYINEKRQSR